MNTTEGSQDIPKTGRIGRFAKIVESKTAKGSYLKIMEKSGEYSKYKSAEKARWWNRAVERLENELGKDKAIEIMRACGRRCCGKGQRKTAKRLMNESSSVEEFIERISTHEVKEGELEYKLLNDNTIIAKHSKCFCGQVKNTKENFKSTTYCQQSIITGGDFCEFVIRIEK